MKYSHKIRQKPDHCIIQKIPMAKSTKVKNQIQKDSNGKKYKSKNKIQKIPMENRMQRQPDRASLLLWNAPPYQTLPERLSIDISKK